MRIYGKDIDIQGEGANANISLSFSRTNMFSFGMDIPKCQILQPPITPMADYCCKYPAVIAGGVGLPVMNVCVNAISKNSVNLCIETAANGDVPIYELFKDAVICGCCRPVTPAIVGALEQIGFCILAVPNYQSDTDCYFGGYANNCLFYEPTGFRGFPAPASLITRDICLFRDCHGYVCQPLIDYTTCYAYTDNEWIPGTFAGDWEQSKAKGGVIDNNDYTFAWNWRNFVECASCWWECNCGVPITGVPELCDDTWLIFPNTREMYLCAPWVMWEGPAYNYCEYIAPKCVFDAGCMPRPLSLKFATWAIEVSCGQYFMRNDLGCYTFDGATHIGGVDTPMPLVVSLYRNGTIYRSLVAYCSDYITCAQVVDIMGGVGLCCNVLYSAVSDSTQLQDMSVPIAVSPSCYDVCVIAFAVDAACKCYPMFGNLMQGATSLVSSDFHYVHIDGGWGTEDVHTHDDSMCYGCVCLPWIGNFFGCGIIDTIRRVSVTYGCYMNGTQVYSPSQDVFNINCALDYCVYTASEYKGGYCTEYDPNFFNCTKSCDVVTPLLSQIENNAIDTYCFNCIAEFDPINCVLCTDVVCAPYSDWFCLCHGGTQRECMCIHHAVLGGYCGYDFEPYAPNGMTIQCCNYYLYDTCCRKEVALARCIGVPAENANMYIRPLVCGPYGRAFMGVGLQYPQCYFGNFDPYVTGMYIQGGYLYDLPTLLEQDCCVAGMFKHQVITYRCMCVPSKDVRMNAVTLTTQPSDTNTILSNGVGSCFVWNGARYRIERIDNYNPTAATCLKVFGVMV